MYEKTLYLMRHGQTLFNLQHKIQGWCDSPLTELGIKQAKSCGKNGLKIMILLLIMPILVRVKECCDTLETL